MGKVEAARGQPDRARSHFQAALDVAPDDAQVRAEVGFQAYRDGRLEDATASYRRALELAPDNAGYWNTYGFLWLLQGNAAEAARAFERSIAIEPSADVLANFATLRSQAGEHDAALALYRRALELDPEDYLNWGNLADGLAASGAPASEVAAAYAEAERRVRRYLALDAGSGYAMAALGWYSANLGRREEALSMVARARVAEHGDPAEIALYNAETLSLLGDAAASERELARARTSGMAEARIRASPVLGQ
ncbi:tetratricopeptide repeat protein [Luteimonas sp. Sa2BVA3]|uniref:Tetratricopeptide repeat protein n=1 Tax=Luteimonas colneyensis TaxID=2762230 RepID=A0ABR8UEJ2_9GAMM|nr:tetratricopeptide repeat protein [Luteimonas colneyensis]MBD7986442.1 tetratricopeptide repeat protein [Luteimonas colneyensis]